MRVVILETPSILKVIIIKNPSKINPKTLRIMKIIKNLPLMMEMINPEILRIEVKKRKKKTSNKTQKQILGKSIKEEDLKQIQMELMEILIINLKINLKTINLKVKKKILLIKKKIKKESSLMIQMILKKLDQMEKAVRGR